MTIKTVSITGLALAAIAAGLIYGQGFPGAPGGSGAPGGGFGGPGGGGRGGGGGWATARGDAQRTAWVRTDAAIAVDVLKKAGSFGLEWKSKMENPTKAANNFTNAISSNTSQLDPAPGNIAGSGNTLWSYEVDTGTQVWVRHFDVAGAAPAATAACPGGLTAAPTRTVALNSPISGAAVGRAGGGRGSARGGVGEPGMGAPPALVQGRGGFGGPGGSGRGGPGGFGGPGGGSGRGPGGPGGGRGGAAIVYIVTSDGVLHGVGQQEGKEVSKPVPFLPANANATDLLLVNNVLYTSTINGCGTAANGVWAMDLGNGNAVKSWKSSASPVGAVAMDNAGTLYVATADGTVTALDPKALTVKDSFTAAGASFTTTPVVIAVGTQEFVVEATKDGKVYLLNTASLGGADHKTPAAMTAVATTKAPAALAAWQDDAKTTWIAVPASGTKSGITALKVGGSASAPSLSVGWTSADIASPTGPVVVNGVLFAASTGSATAPSVLYGIDAANGSAIWNSGKSITSYIRSGGLWTISGQVHVATADGTIYSFSTAQDRHW